MAVAGWAFAIPGALQDLPKFFGEVTVWSLIVYFVVGFQATADRCVPVVFCVELDVDLHQYTACASSPRVRWKVLPNAQIKVVSRHRPCRFFCFWGTLICLQMQSSALYRFIGAAIRSPITGTSVAVLLTLVNILGSGFVLIRSEMPVYWRWVTWVAPLSYTFTGAPVFAFALIM